jgi:hypothetical protein
VFLVFSLLYTLYLSQFLILSLFLSPLPYSYTLPLLLTPTYLSLLYICSNLYYNILISYLCLLSTLYIFYYLYSLSHIPKTPFFLFRFNPSNLNREPSRLTGLRYALY